MKNRMNTYLLYLRRPTDKGDLQLGPVTEQKYKLIEFAEHNGFSIAGVIEERHVPAKG